MCCTRVGLVGTFSCIRRGPQIVPLTLQCYDILSAERSSSRLIDRAHGRDTSGRGLFEDGLVLITHTLEPYALYVRALKLFRTHGTLWISPHVVLQKYVEWYTSHQYVYNMQCACSEQCTQCPFSPCSVLRLLHSFPRTAGQEQFSSSRWKQGQQLFNPSPCTCAYHPDELKYN